MPSLTWLRHHITAVILPISFRIGIGLLCIGILALVLDWTTGTHFARPAAHVLGGFGGSMLFLLAIGVAFLSRQQRLGLVVMGGLLWAATLDSLTGNAQPVLLDRVILGTWGLIFLWYGTQLPAATHVPPWRRWMAFLLSSSAVCALCVVAWASWANTTTVDRTVSALAPFLLLILHVMAPLHSSALRLSGAIQICPACGLPNIIERRTCKRCQTILDPT